ncbi:MAG: hypothetical protein MUD14_16025 [Hydrococcus sp. Prado102]|jgi:hypothetical protein|nr:hypothetical protein [Hydrococcus sp. Prado102]
MNASKQILLIIIIFSLATFASSILVLIGGLQGGIFGIFATICIVVAYQYPRLGLWLFLIYLPFSGTITYAFGNIFSSIDGRVAFTSGYPLFHLAKDLFYLPALISILIRSQVFQKFQLIAKPLILSICALLVACLLTFLAMDFPQYLQSLESGTLLATAIGLRALIGYIPLLFCGYYLIRDRNDLFFLSRLFVILTIICCIFCFIQYFLLVQGICPGNASLPEPAVDKATLLARCFVGGSLLYNPGLGLIRLPGTFVAPWQWAWFLIANSFFVYGAVVSDSSRFWRWIGWIAVGMLIVTIIITGQRVSLVGVPIVFLTLFLFNQSSKKKILIKLTVITFLIILAINTIGIVRVQYYDLIDRWSYSRPDLFVIDQFKWVFQKGNSWLGHGLGGATNSARRLGEIVLIETFYAKLFYEIGLLGVTAFLCVVSSLSWLTFKVYSSLQKSSVRRLALCLWIFILFMSYNTYYYPLSVDPVAVYYWFIGGVLLKLPELDKEFSREG